MRAHRTGRAVLLAAWLGCGSPTARQLHPEAGDDVPNPADAAAAARGGASGSGGRAGAPGTAGAGGTAGMPAVGGQDGAARDASAPDGSADAGTVATGRVSWTTYKFDNGRTGWNPSEHTLTPALVAGGAKFGKLFSHPVDGQMYAQPLVASGVTVGGKLRNLVLVATQTNNAYAFDADDAAARDPLWTASFGKPVTTAEVQGTPDIAPLIGITATPVVDLATATLYLTTKTVENGSYEHRLHALDLVTGHEKNGGPVALSASVPGTADGARNGTLAFDARIHLNRPGLLLQAGTVYIAFGSHSDANQYHGWVMAYDAVTLKPKGVFVTAPGKGHGAGIWMAGNGLVGDGSAIYFATGNGFSGSTDPTTTPPQLGESLVKLDSALALKDWGMRGGYVQLDGADADYGSSGPLLLPRIDMLVSGGKDAALLLYDKNNLGKYNATDMVAQKFTGTGPNVLRGRHFGGLVYWESGAGPILFAWPDQGKLLGFKLGADRKFDPTPVAVGPDLSTSPRSGFMAISSDGPRGGIVWANVGEGDTSFFTRPGTLRAYDAADGKLLWRSDANKGRDDLGLFAKMSPPTVANGKVYVSSWTGTMVDATGHALDSRSTLQVYGPLP